MLARATAALRSVCMAPENTGIIDPPIPRPMTNSTTPSHQYDVVAVTCVSATNDAMMSSIPGSTILPTPMRSVSFPAMGIVIIAPMPCGAMSRPLASAVSPRTACRYSGSRSMPPNTASANTVSVADAAAKTRFLKSRRSSNGCSVRSP